MAVMVCVWSWSTVLSVMVRMVYHAVCSVVLCLVCVVCWGGGGGQGVL